MIAEPCNMMLDVATRRSGCFEPKSESVVGVRSDTRVDPRPRLLREVSAHFEAGSMGPRVPENRSREDLDRRDHARVETRGAGAQRASEARRGVGGAGDRTCL